MGTLAAVAVIVGLTIFFLTPRTWLSRRPPIDPSRTAGAAAFTGFTGEVRLGALGEILESNEPAFDVEIERPRLGRSLESNDAAEVFGTEEPLFRGRTLDHYEQGRWSDSGDSRSDWLTLSHVPPPPSRITAIERYRLRPIGDEVLFQAGQAAAVTFPNADSARSSKRLSDGLLVRPKAVSATTEVEYVVYSADPSARYGSIGWSRLPGWSGQGDGSPPDAADGLKGDASRPELPEGLRLRYLQSPGELPAVAAAATDALAGSTERTSERATAERLTSYLRDSGRFGYSLDLSVQDPTIDAVEDFLANKRVGHCEYFATALALMLRERDIPSRVVTGFKGGDLNKTTRRFEVQQRHAHAWVEGFVDGRWRTFDATPAAARTQSVAESGPRFARLANLVNGVEFIWAEYVVRMSLERQRTAFGRPLRDAWETFRLAATRFVSGPNGSGWQFDAKSGALAAVILLALVGAAWAARGLFARTWRRRKESRARASAVRFWRRFVRLAARRGVIRGVAETPSEFAARAAQAWRPTVGEELAALPISAASEFYAVRFGGAALSPERVSQLSASLDRLEARLSGRT
ncbi:hypothetical protein LzC2_42000 [Planctomycetes bacterium LzC2]|uniref:Transglutaminase-like domain-containing protein n=1 Tax=Alienimonas chondri TaxID=2681879 RepID=A0ABX1VJN4_9PLAN|nr:hypothetical protein [Alienimonas chondri]